MCVTSRVGAKHGCLYKLDTFQTFFYAFITAPMDSRARPLSLKPPSLAKIKALVSFFSLERTTYWERDFQQKYIRRQRMQELRRRHKITTWLFRGEWCPLDPTLLLLSENLSCRNCAEIILIVARNACLMYVHPHEITDNH